MASAVETPERTLAVGRAEVIKRRRKGSRMRRIKQGWQLYAMLALPIIYLALFNYWPMLGVQIAFRNYNPVDGIWGSEWVGFENFDRFVDSYLFWRLIKNTLILQLYGLFATFPLPIILALALNYVRRKWFSRTVQMITYAPHFISTVVIVGMLFLMLDPNTGVLATMFGWVGIDTPDFMRDPAWFRHTYVWTGAWQAMGFSAIIYLAALSGVDPQQHEAAIVDGATKIRRMWHIDLPAIAPVATILLILSMGGILTTGFEKVLLMQTPLNLQTSEVIDTYVYKVSLGSEVPQFSYGAAIGVFQSVVGLVLLIMVNRIAKKVNGSGIW